MNIGFLGAGKMAEGVLLAIANKRSVIMSGRTTTHIKLLKRKYGVTVTTNVEDVAKKSDLIFLAVKPQDVEEVAQKVKPILSSKSTLVSLVAGKSLKNLRKSFGNQVKLVRVMPNLALRVGEGMCVVCASKTTPKVRVAAVLNILNSAGKAIILKEKYFDAVTALSGSGPAYFAYMEAAMIAGGVKLGLKHEVARLLAEQTMLGTAKFLRDNKTPLDEFIAGVCTKGGTTEAGMVAMAGSNFKNIVAQTLSLAARRSKELNR